MDPNLPTTNLFEYDAIKRMNRTVPSAIATVSDHPDEDPPTGMRVVAQDFQLLRMLGRGSFAAVYLARQTSLNRLVALKLSEQPGRGEALVLAALEHDHIVKVYSEVHDEVFHQHGLVLQYIPGVDLGRVLEQIIQSGLPKSGEEILESIDGLIAEEVPFDPSALVDREVYRRPYPVVICRLMAKLADALAFAHSRNVLHCDIKPANILLNRYGRPMLADFNVAVPSARPDEPSTPVGGTLLYMSPEHLGAFGQMEDQPRVDQRTDQFALALVTLELLTGRLLPRKEDSVRGLAMIIALWCDRQKGPDVWLAEFRSRTPPPVWRVIRRCLSFLPSDRYATASEMAEALRGAAEQLERETAVPTSSWLTRFTLSQPILVLFLLTFLPHIIGSIVNITYNRIAMPMDAAMADRFAIVTMWYNVIVYPVALALTITIFIPIVRFLRSLDLIRTNDELDRLRSRSLRLGDRAAALAAFGWFPGGILFPLVLMDPHQPFDWPLFGHFFLSFTISGLIALTYSFLGIHYFVIRVLYPRLVYPELASSVRQRDWTRIAIGLGCVPFAAASVPLLGATAQTLFAPNQFTLEFRLLITGLIIAGMIGLGVTIGVTRHLRRVIQRVTGGEH